MGSPEINTVGNSGPYKLWAPKKKLLGGPAFMAFISEFFQGQFFEQELYQFCSW